MAHAKPIKKRMQRSQFAKFDPKKADSRDILAGVGYTAFGGLGALSGLDEGT